MLHFMASYVSPLFFILLKLSFTAGILGLLVLIIRKLGEQKLPAFWKNILWLLVLLALLIPYKLPSEHAIFRESTAIITAIDKGIFPQNTSPISPEPSGISPSILGATSPSFFWDIALPILWILGVCVMLIVLTIGHKRLQKSVILGNNIPVSGALWMQLEACKARLDITAEVGICTQSYLSSPALLGLRKPKILLPTYAETLSKESLDCILLHELCHLKHKDLLKNAVLLTLQVIYWFNPLIWLLFRYIRQDMEQLNDARVLAILENKEQKAYALSLVEVLAHVNRLAIAPQMLTMVDGKGNTKRRIEMMKLGESFKKQRHIIALVCVTVIALLSVVFFTEKPAAEAENPDQTPTTIALGLYQSQPIPQENGFDAEPYLNFTEDGLLEFFFSLDSSMYFSSLPYEIQDDKLVFSIKTPYPENSSTYVFNIVGDSLILDLDASDNPYFGGVTIPDGTVFPWTTDTDIPQTMEEVIVSHSVATWPLNFAYTAISAPYGMRTHPVTGETSFATSICIPAPEGTEIYAILDGEIQETGYSSELGNYCLLETVTGITAIYSHMKDVFVDEGALVTQSQILGTVGQTGTATGSLLGYELRENDTAIDPMIYHQGMG